MWSKAKRMLFAGAVSGLLIAGMGSPVQADIVINLGRGPVTVRVPPSYDPDVPTPLVLLLHGYGANGNWQEAYFQFQPLADQYGFLYAHPDGTVDAAGYRFWNATDACCNFYGSGVDDSGYLLSLVDEIKAQLNVDAGRVFFVGHSNGGFMAYRMACDHPETIAAIVSLAGATFADPADCSPGVPVRVLQIHGTADATILYGGGLIYGVPYPGAVETVEQWAAFDGCDPIGTPMPDSLDLVADIPGDETIVYRYDTGCDPDGSAELWSIQGGSHIPSLTANFGPLVIDFLLGHAVAVQPVWSATVSSSHPVLLPPTPNPSQEETSFRYRLPEAVPVVLTIRDVAGRSVRTILSGEVQSAGFHRQVWDGRGEDGRPVASGIYFVTLETDSRSTAQKIVLVK